MSNPTTEPTNANDEELNEANLSEESLLEKLQADLERFRDLALRSQADFENFMFDVQVVWRYEPRVRLGDVLQTVNQPLGNDRLHSQRVKADC